MPQSRHIKIRGGLDVAISGAPRQVITRSPPLDSVAVFARDYPGMRPALRVDVGDDVREGQVLFVDRHRPAIAVTSPVVGTVSDVRRGPGRRLQAVIIQASPAPTASPHAATSQAVPIDGTSRDEVQQALLRYGLWPALTARPYGEIPDPGTLPDDILVTAIDTNPMAADPRVVIAAYEDAFLRGVEVLETLTDGRVLVCQAKGPPLAAGAVTFEGRHPSGLPGTHIHHLTALGRGGVGGQVWHLDYQDTIAIGSLFSTGRPWTDRVISLGGPAVRDPRLIRVPMGARIAALTEGELSNADGLAISGSVLSGEEREFLGRRHLQVTVLEQRPHSEPGPMVPTTELERVAPTSRAPAMLLRSLSVGDEQDAVQLGALALLEEDVALSSYACASGANYGPLLRNVLDKIRGREVTLPTLPEPTNTAPYLRAWRSQREIIVWYAVALVAPLAAVVYQNGLVTLATLALSLATVFAWQLLFATARKRALGLDGIVTAASLAILLPVNTPPWQIALGASFGTVLAEQVFGGRGYGFVNPAVAALAFLSFSFTNANYGGPVPLHWLAVVPAALVLIRAKMLSWRVLAGTALGYGSLAYATGHLSWPGHDACGTALFALVFLAGDPVNASVTNPGRWVYGVLIGGLIALGGGDDSAILPILVGQIFAPLIDQTIVRLSAHFRVPRHA